MTFPWLWCAEDSKPKQLSVCKNIPYQPSKYFVSCFFFNNTCRWFKSSDTTHWHTYILTNKVFFNWIYVFCRTNIFQHLGRLSSRFPWQVFSYYSLCYFSRKQSQNSVEWGNQKPKKSDTRDAGYWWLRLCIVAPAAFCFSWDTLPHIVKWFRLPMHCDRAQYADSLEKVCGQLFINCS